MHNMCDKFPHSVVDLCQSVERFAFPQARRQQEIKTINRFNEVPRP
jgi:hypothetical protein